MLLNVFSCFPHCCPHTEQRRCGTSLSLRFQTFIPIDQRRLLICGRLESASELPFRNINDSILLTTITNEIRTQTTPFGMWVVGRITTIYDVCDSYSISLIYNFLCKYIKHI